MSKKRSLGSSPIGFKSDNSSMGFIPDLGVSGKKKKGSSNSNSIVDKTQSKQKEEKPSSEKKSKKKIVSYNLEIDLVEEVKDIANEKGMYYSSLVSLALRCWIMENG